MSDDLEASEVVVTSPWNTELCKCEAEVGVVFGRKWKQTRAEKLDSRKA